MSYKRVNWINDSEPDLSAENLNIMDKGIEDVDIGLIETNKKIEKLSSEVESATAELDKKISNTPGAVTTDNIADKAITTAKIAKIDNVPTAGSTSLVYSTGVYTAIDNAKKSLQNNVDEKEPSANKITNFDTTLTDEEKFPTARAVVGFVDENVYYNHEIDEMLSGKANNSDLRSVSDDLQTVSANVASNTAAIAQKANNSDLQTVSANVASNTAAIAQKANNSDLQTVSSKVAANTKSIGNVYTKSEIKSRFAQGISAIYDSVGNIVKATDLSTLSGGALAGDTTITTAFIANNVTHLQSGCFAGCTNLQTVYIDNIQGKITVDSGAIPSTATVIYTDEFNPVTANAKAILALRSSIGDINNALTELSALADSYITDTAAATTSDTSEEVQ